MTPATRDALLTAIAKARCWIDDLVSGKAASFAEIAEREGKVERHIRFPAPLAFIFPWVLGAIASGSAVADLTVSVLAKGMPLSSTEQRNRFDATRLG
jgi:site-specific DNA recombinase